MSSPATLLRPLTPNAVSQERPTISYPHWSHAVYECEISERLDVSFDLVVEGGSDNGEFPYFGSHHSLYKSISKDDILLEIQGQKVAGYTQRDVIALLGHCSRNGNTVKVKAVKAGCLTKDLRCYLNMRFQKGSIDHDLQNVIRDNLYLRTVPCTTRTPRCGENNGVDYTFLSVEEFFALERSGNLLESGIYEGNLYGTPRPAPAATAFGAFVPNVVQTSNHYGTPIPSKDVPHPAARRNNSIGSCNNVVLPGTHASSKGKRRRNRSNVEAMASKMSDISDYSPLPLPPRNSQNSINFSPWNNAQLSPREQKCAVEDFRDHDLPFGWERIDDPHYGTYYIDHVNRRTQYENPVLRPSIDVQTTPKDIISPIMLHSTPDHRNDSNRSFAFSPNSDGRKSPRTSRNSSLTHTTNCSNAGDSITPANTNSECPLINGNSPSLPPLTAPSSMLNSSPTATHRFPYLHCIPCLNEKHDPPKHDLPIDTSNILMNGTIASETDVKQREETNPLLTPVSLANSRNNSFFQHRNDSSSHDFSRPSSMTGLNGTLTKHPLFTLNPEELKGIFIQTKLVKSSRGLGFTIIGGDSPMAQDFLQIKDVVPYGPAWCDGKLQTGDVLVHVNNVCVLGYTHQDIIMLFQSIPPGEIVQFEVCRGYSLPYDPSDPNTEIVTTVAVSVAIAKGSESQNIYSMSHTRNGNGNNHHSQSLNVSSSNKNSDPMARSAKSMPDLTSKPPDSLQNGVRKHKPMSPTPRSSNSHTFPAKLDNTPEYITFEIVKGPAGFGFTIADSSYGQKVKKILDHPRCSQLQEGDILTEINGREIQTHLHAEVVQILKDCPVGIPALIVVQRGGFLTPNKNKMKMEAKNHNQPNSRAQGGSAYNEITGYRSKTPTAELYSSHNKESIVVPRPKTPIVDLRNWTKSSPITPSNTNHYNHHWLNSPQDKFEYSESTNRRNGNKKDDTPLAGKNFRTSPWFSQENHPTEPYPNQTSPNASSLPQNSEDFENIDHTLPNWEIGPYSPSAHPLNRFQEVEHTYSMMMAKNNCFNDIASNRGKDSNTSNATELSLTDWQQSLKSSFSSPAENQRSADHSNSYSLMKYGYPDDALTSYRGQMHHSPAYMNVPNGSNTSNSTFNDMGLNKEYTVSKSTPTTMSSTSFLFNAASQSFDSHHSKHGTSFEHEDPVPCNSQDLSPKVGHSNLEATQTTTTADFPSMYMVVTLMKQNTGFGFRIVGGTEEGSQVSVGHIVPDGAADLDGRIQSGDEILGVDGQSMLNSSHRLVVQLMSKAASNGKVTLHLRRPSSNGNSSCPKLFQNAPYCEVIVKRKENEGFGFVLISSVSRKGSAIGRIIEGSPADRCGQLHIGDVIEAVNGISILNMHHSEIVNLIKDSGFSISLTVNHLSNEPNFASMSQKVEDSVFGLDASFHSIKLERGTKGFGFSIRGGREFQNMPLFVLRIAENGPAHHDGGLRVCDQIMEINGVSTKNMTHAEAIELIRGGGNSICLLVKRNSNDQGTNSADLLGPHHTVMPLQGHKISAVTCDPVNLDTP